MKSNVGSIDRVLRVLAGIVLLVIGFAVLGGTAGIVVGVIGLIPLTTGLIGWCPLYNLFHLRTRKQN
jgi:Inner membrane protein YgaP-like, transmembrane domain